MNNQDDIENRRCRSRAVRCWYQPVPPRQSPPAPAANGKTIVMSIGRGQQVNLPTAVTDVVVADPAVADVDVRSSRQTVHPGERPW